MTLSEAPELAPKLPSNSLLADSVARLVSAATVETKFDVPVEFGAALPGVAEAWLLVTLPIDILASIADDRNLGYRPEIKELEEDCGWLNTLCLQRSCSLANELQGVRSKSFERGKPK